ncbi:MAG: carbohydrate ABC transporter permease [Clostridia bacterium]|nr:carbohydrate ABC transporter permease [Clostridia bacterium]
MKNKNKNKIVTTSPGDICLDIFVNVFLMLVALSMLIPFMNVISKAFSADWAIISGKVGIFPVDFNCDAIKHVVTSGSFWNSLYISVFVTALGTLCNLIMSVTTAYVLSKRYLPGVKTIMLLFVFTMLFGGGMVPNYLLMKKLNLINNLAVLVLPSLISVYNMIIIKSYFEGLPESVEESARLDGAGNLTILFRIVLPMSTPVLATIALFYAVYHWNNYMGPLLYINKSNLKPLQLYLNDILLEAQDTGVDKTSSELMNVTGEGVRSATIVLSTLPILLVYPWLQKYFVKGITIGSVKG